MSTLDNVVDDAEECDGVANEDVGDDDLTTLDFDAATFELAAAAAGWPGPEGAHAGFFGASGAGIANLDGMLGDEASPEERAGGAI
jgi:hypothetical protein